MGRLKPKVSNEVPGWMGMGGERVQGEGVYEVEKYKLVQGSKKENDFIAKRVTEKGMTYQ